MEKTTVLKISLFVSICAAIVAYTLPMLHKPGAEVCLILSLIAGIIFIFSAIAEVSRSERIDRSEKIMWIVGFLFLTGISGIIYVFSARKRVV